MNPGGLRRYFYNTAMGISTMSNDIKTSWTATAEEQNPGSFFKKPEIEIK